MPPRDAAVRAIKAALYHCGAYGLAHRWRNRRKLTTLMFHRVLPAHDPRAETALGDWTVSDAMFEECVRFLKKHYRLVSLPMVLRSFTEGAALPDHSLLITFDDGYADVAEYAAPILRKLEAPAALFVYLDAVGQNARPWPEEFVWLHEAGRLRPGEIEQLRRAVAPEAREGKGEEGEGEEVALRSVATLGAQYAASDIAGLDAILARAPTIEAPQMLNASQLASLVDEAKMTIGAHGKTHTALTGAANVAAELDEPRSGLQRLLAGTGQKEVRALAFPFGAYDQAIAERALASGYDLLFTVEEVLTDLKDGRLADPILGRLNISAAALAPQGAFLPELAAHRLFLARSGVPSIRAASS